MTFTTTLKDLLDTCSVEYVYSRPIGIRLLDIERHLKQIGQRLAFQTTEPGLRLRLLADWNDVLVPNMPVEVINYAGKEPVHVDSRGIPSLEGYRFLNRGLEGDRTPSGLPWAEKSCRVEKCTASFDSTGTVTSQVLYSTPK